MERDLDVVISQVNGIVINGEGSNNHKPQAKHKRSLNAALIASRMPLNPIPVRWKNEIFDKLLKFDRCVSGEGFPGTSQSDILVVLRRGLIRLLKVVSRAVIEAS